MKNLINTIEKLNTMLLSQKEILTIDELSDYLGIDVDEVQELVVTKKIPFYQPLRKYTFFKRLEVDKWILGGKIKN